MSYKKTSNCVVLYQQLEDATVLIFFPNMRPDT